MKKKVGKQVVRIEIVMDIIYGSGFQRELVEGWIMSSLKVIADLVPLQHQDNQIYYEMKVVEKKDEGKKIVKRRG